MFGISFLNPGLLIGSLLVAAPILIHLLNRRRFRIVDWAAMEFLLEADLRNRRRIRLEHLILLLLRCALIVSRNFSVRLPSLHPVTTVTASVAQRSISTHTRSCLDLVGSSIPTARHPSMARRTPRT